MRHSPGLAQFTGGPKRNDLPHSFRRSPLPGTFPAKSCCPLIYCQCFWCSERPRPMSSYICDFTFVCRGSLYTSCTWAWSLLPRNSSPKFQMEWTTFVRCQTCICQFPIPSVNTIEFFPAISRPFTGQSFRCTLPERPRTKWCGSAGEPRVSNPAWCRWWLVGPPSPKRKSCLWLVAAKHEECGAPRTA